MANLAFSLMQMDTKITHSVYIGGIVVFVLALVLIFVYNARMKTRQVTERKFGRPPVDETEGIAAATEDGKNSEKEFGMIDKKPRT